MGERKKIKECNNLKATLTVKIEELNRTIIRINENKTCPGKLAECRKQIEIKSTIIITKEKEIERKIVILKECEKKEDTCTKEKEKIRIEYEKKEILKMYKDCTSTHDKDLEIIAQLKLLIKKTSADYKLIIQNIRIEHDAKVEELLKLIRVTQSSSVSIKVTIESYEKKIVVFDASIKKYTQRIENLLKIIKEQESDRDSLFERLDTIDSNSFHMVSEIKQKITEITREISTNYVSYENYYQLLIREKEEWARYSALLEIYKKQTEENNEYIEKYNALKAELKKYIEQLKKLAEENNKIKIDSSTEIDISVYIKGIETQDPNIKFKIEHAIENFKVQIEEMKRKYEIEIKKYHALIDKEKEGCNSRITIIEQQKQQCEENCENKINVRITELTKTHETYVIQLNANYRKQIIELKKKISTNICSNIGGDGDTYNFERYKKHCMIVIEKNTENDCKTITDIRDHYNTKCIMTSLPTTKDLTTFASSDFNDDRNSGMMKRLNTKN